MDSSIELEASVVAVDRADLIPPSSVSVQPNVAGVSTQRVDEGLSVVSVFAFLAILMLSILIVFIKIKRIRAHHQAVSTMIAA